MSRKIQFKNGEYYHVYNRGVDKRDIFLDDNDYQRFVESLTYFNKQETIQSIYLEKKREITKNFPGLSEAGPLYRGPASDPSNPGLTKITTRNLLPNHFHLQLQQLVNNGISTFMHKLCTGYAMYFNRKYNRSGALFQGRFKAIHINTEEYLLWLQAYIVGNSEIHDIQKYTKWPWFYCQNKNLPDEYIKMVIRKSKLNKKYQRYKLENDN